MSTYSRYAAEKAVEELQRLVGAKDYGPIIDKTKIYTKNLWNDSLLCSLPHRVLLELAYASEREGHQWSQMAKHFNSKYPSDDPLDLALIKVRAADTDLEVLYCVAHGLSHEIFFSFAENGYNFKAGDRVSDELRMAYEMMGELNDVQTLYFSSYLDDREEDLKQVEPYSLLFPQTPIRDTMAALFVERAIPQSWSPDMATATLVDFDGKKTGVVEIRFPLSEEFQWAECDLLYTRSGPTPKEMLRSYINRTFTVHQGCIRKKDVFFFLPSSIANAFFDSGEGQYDPS